jgi:dihydrofolate synthase/folylpolyglutamate synthase
MNYNETLKYFEHLEMFGIKLGLQNIKKLLSLSGNPEKNLRFVHIAGTNGKGSTAVFIAEILKASGYRVGLYTSPHLNRFEERILLNGNYISRPSLTALTNYYRELIEKERDFSPTYFEIATAIALKYFSEKKVEIVIMEAGLGGRLDATNIIKPEVCVITGISRDHTRFLGNRISDIAEEKFSIIKPGAGVVAYLEQRPLRKRLKDICKRGRNSAMFVGEDINSNLRKTSLGGQVFTLSPARCRVKIKLLGRHQLINAGLAFGATRILSGRGFNINLSHIRKGLEQAVWPGRFEILKTRPYIVLDGAHNLEAIKKLKETLSYYFSDRKIILVLGIMSDKDWPRMSRAIASLAAGVVTCSIESSRAHPAESIARAVRKVNKDVIACGTLREAVSAALDRAGKKDVICITGSLHVVGEARRFLKLA